MAQKKVAKDGVTELKTKVQEGQILAGSDRVLKAVKAQQLGKVFLAKNCPAKMKEDLQYYARLAGIPVVQLEQSNDELGILCKKNYFVAVVGIR